MFNNFAMILIIVIIVCMGAWAIATERNKGSKRE
jgi:hypothetical protein